MEDLRGNEQHSKKRTQNTQKKIEPKTGKGDTNLMRDLAHSCISIYLYM